MVARNFGKKYGGPWFNDYKQRGIFERGVAGVFPEIRTNVFREKSSPKIEYKIDVDVPYYGVARKVLIILSSSTTAFPRIKVNGPEDSKHRYKGGYLCIWYPWEEISENRWQFSDGLLHLLALIQLHLFREEWWRETGEWLGPEVHHLDAVEAPEND